MKIYFWNIMGCPEKSTLSHLLTRLSGIEKHMNLTVLTLSQTFTD